MFQFEMVPSVCDWVLQMCSSSVLMFVLCNSMCLCSRVPCSGLCLCLSCLCFSSRCVRWVFVYQCFVCVDVFWFVFVCLFVTVLHLVFQNTHSSCTSLDTSLKLKRSSSCLSRCSTHTTFVSVFVE